MNPPEPYKETAAETLRRHLPQTLGADLYDAIIEILREHDCILEAIAELNARIKALKKTRY
jgi:hypothetical protein